MKHERIVYDTREESGDFGYRCLSPSRDTNLYKDLPKETNDLAFSHLGGVPNLHIAAEV